MYVCVDEDPVEACVLSPQFQVTVGPAPEPASVTVPAVETRSPTLAVAGAVNESCGAVRSTFTKPHCEADRPAVSAAVIWFALPGTSGSELLAEIAQTVTGPSGSGGVSVTEQSNSLILAEGSVVPFTGTEQFAL